MAVTAEVVLLLPPPPFPLRLKRENWRERTLFLAVGRSAGANLRKGEEDAAVAEEVMCLHTTLEVLRQRYIVRLDTRSKK